MKNKVIQGAKPQAVHMYGTDFCWRFSALQNRSHRAKAQQRRSTLLCISLYKGDVSGIIARPTVDYGIYAGKENAA